MVIVFVVSPFFIAVEVVPQYLSAEDKPRSDAVIVTASEPLNVFVPTVNEFVTLPAELAYPAVPAVAASAEELADPAVSAYLTD